MGTKKLLLVIMLLFSMGALAYALIDNVWAQDEQDSLKYNTFENKWDYAGEDDTLKYNPLENEWESQLQLEGETFADCAARADFREGVTAFAEKRKPNFTGN